MKRASAIAENRRRAVVLVELAVLMPIFLVLVCGIVEFGRAMIVSQLATRAAEFGAQAAILEGSTNSHVEEEVKEFLAKTVKGIDTKDVSVNITVSPDHSNQDSRDRCQVTVIVPYSQVAYVSPRFLKNTNLRGECSLRCE